MAKFSKKVYISSNLIFAFIDRGNQRHEQASAYFRYFSEQEYQLFIDPVTINDCYNKIFSKMSPSVGMDFLKIIFLSDINIIYPEESEYRAALKSLVNYRTLDLSYAEALMAVLANKRAIPQIATFEFLHPLFGLQVFFLPI